MCSSGCAGGLCVCGSGLVLIRPVKQGQSSFGLGLALLEKYLLSHVWFMYYESCQFNPAHGSKWNSIQHPVHECGQDR